MAEACILDLYMDYLQKSTDLDMDLGVKIGRKTLLQNLKFLMVKQTTLSVCAGVKC